MPSPWIDLLCLHGHIADATLLRRLAMRHAEPPRPRPDPKTGSMARAKQAVSRWRLCLGIGDGLLRCQ